MASSPIDCPSTAAPVVLEHGGDEDTAIATLLHDAPEDQGGRAMLAQIGARFGERVERIVEGCTDTFEAPERCCARGEPADDGSGAELRARQRRQPAVDFGSVELPICDA